jgi:hypothetical protein
MTRGRRAALLLGSLVIGGCYDVDSLAKGQGPISLRGYSKIVGMAPPTLSIPLPAGIAPGDLLWLGLNNTLAAAPPLGWMRQSSDGTGCNGAVFLMTLWHAVDGHEGPTVDLELYYSNTTSVILVALAGALPPPSGIDDEAKTAHPAGADTLELPGLMLRQPADDVLTFLTWNDGRPAWPMVDGDGKVAETDWLVAYEERPADAGPTPPHTAIVPATAGCGVSYRVALHPR